MRLPTACFFLLLVVVVGCTSGPAERPVATPAMVPSAAAPPTDGVLSPLATPRSTPLAKAPPSPRVRPQTPQVETAVGTVRHLAGVIGPRHATSAAFRRATWWTAGRLRSFGYDVRLQRFPVPAGISWGVPVRRGRSANVVASPRGFDPRRPHLVVGAHLDTVPQAPGAEDNASGVGVLLSVAEAVAGTRARLPVLLVAFGAEEPRGPTDEDHHYGSRHYVDSLSRAERRALRGMVSLDRVGVGRLLPVCGARQEADRFERAVLRAARRVRVPVTSCGVNRSSDHWSFVRAGLPGVRLGSTPYAGYHNPGDVPSVVSRAQLSRAGRTVVSWLSGT